MFMIETGAMSVVNDAERVEWGGDSGASEALAIHAYTFVLIVYLLAEQEHLDLSPEISSPSSSHSSFEYDNRSQMSGLPSPLRGSLWTFETAARGEDELIRGAMSVVNAAERVQGVMRNGNSRALEEQINAEVEGPTGDVEQVWRRVGSDFREGVRAGEDLGRAVTALLLSVSKILRERETTRRRNTNMAADTLSSALRYPETLVTRILGARWRTLTSISNVAEPTTTTTLTVGVDAPLNTNERFSKPDKGPTLDDLHR